MSQVILFDLSMVLLDRVVKVSPKVYNMHWKKWVIQKKISMGCAAFVGPLKRTVYEILRI